MRRLEYYEIKIRRKRIICFFFIISIIILLLGLVFVDYIINSMLGVNDNIINLENIDSDIYELKFMDSVYEINIEYIKRDFSNIRTNSAKYFETLKHNLSMLFDKCKDFIKNMKRLKMENSNTNCSPFSILSLIFLWLFFLF